MDVETNSNNKLFTSENIILNNEIGKNGHIN